MSIEMPYALKDEEMLAGCALHGGSETASSILEAVPPGILSSALARNLMLVAESLVTSGESFDLTTIRATWSKVHPRAEFPFNEFATVAECVPSAWRHHSGAILDAHRRRKIIGSFHQLLTDAQRKGTDLDQLIAAAEKAFDGEEITSANVVGSKEASTALINDLERRFNLQGALSGVGSGFIDLDKILDGLQYGEQTVIAARPSIGKTAIGLNIAANALFNLGIPTLIVTREMRPESLCRRMLSSRKSIGMGALRSGKLMEHDIPKTTLFASELAKAPVQFINAVRGISVAQLCAAARRIIRRHGVKLVVIDYLQKIQPDSKHEKRTYEVGAVSGQLKALADSTGVALVTLAQLNRENEKDKGRLPRLADLADSAQIERDADTVCLLHRKRDEPHGEAQLIVAKQRDGECGMVSLNFNGQFCRFENATYKHDEH